MDLIQESQLLPCQLKLLSNATTIDVIYSNTLAEIVIPLPPFDEQRKIHAFICQRVAAVQQAIDAAQREIELLREYRTRLIADVVTGKLDVRDVPVPTDETDVLPEDVETIDDVEAVDQTDDVAEGNSKSSTEENA